MSIEFVFVERNRLLPDLRPFLLQSCALVFGKDFWAHGLAFRIEQFATEIGVAHVISSDGYFKLRGFLFCIAA
jgi:hypothetical protein